MKKQIIPGWAVIFAATLFLVVCATQDVQAASYYKLAGADATVAQEQSTQFYEDSAIFVSPDWLDVRENEIEQKELALSQDEGSSIVVTPDWMDVRESMIEEKELELARRENAVVITQSWLDERARQLAIQSDELDRRENYLAINQAWLNEREMQLSMRGADLTRQEDMLAFKQTFVDEGDTRLAIDVPDLTRQEEIYTFNQKAWLNKLVSKPAKPERCYAQVFVPAEYLAVASKVLISEPTEDGAPARFQTVTKHVKVSDDHMAMEEVLCGSDMTEDRIKDIQRALSLCGYNAGPIDGVPGPRTMSAVHDFQKDHGLIVANHLTVETVETLGVE